MIERRIVKTKPYMRGFVVNVEDKSISIGVGELAKEDKTITFEPVSIDLFSDAEVPILYDLYIVEDNENYFYDLEATYLDGEVMPAYTGNYNLFHAFISVEVSPTRAKKGHITHIEEKENTESEHTVTKEGGKGNEIITEGEK